MAAPAPESQRTKAPERFTPPENDPRNGGTRRPGLPLEVGHLGNSAPFVPNNLSQLRVPAPNSTPNAE